MSWCRLLGIQLIWCLLYDNCFLKDLVLSIYLINAKFLLLFFFLFTIWALNGADFVLKVKNSITICQNKSSFHVLFWLIVSHYGMLTIILVEISDSTQIKVSQDHSSLLIWLNIMTRSFSTTWSSCCPLNSCHFL